MAGALIGSAVISCQHCFRRNDRDVSNTLECILVIFLREFLGFFFQLFSLKFIISVIQQPLLVVICARFECMHVNMVYGTAVLLHDY